MTDLDNKTNTTQPVDIMLAREIRELDREMMPTRNLWEGIERNISEFPQSKKREWSTNWMPYGIAASFLVAFSALVLNVVNMQQEISPMLSAGATINTVQEGYLQVRNPLVDRFSETNKTLAPETLDDLYKNIEIMAKARRDIEEQVRQNPDNQRLVTMLMRIHEQELQLLKQDYSKPGRSM